MNDMLDGLAHYEMSRVFVFDGIASTVEYAMPKFKSNRNLPSTSSRGFAGTESEVVVASYESDSSQTPTNLSAEACTVLLRILTRFVMNYYSGDQSLIIPAMLCLEKVYRRKVELLLAQDKQQYLSTNNVVNIDRMVLKNVTPSTSACTYEGGDVVPDPDLWQNVTVALYSVCRSSDPEASTVATQSLERILLRLHPRALRQIQGSTWITLLYLMVQKQPTVVSETSRSNTFSILGQLLVNIVPTLLIRSHAHDNSTNNAEEEETDEDYRTDLEDLLLQFSALAMENIQSVCTGTANILREPKDPRGNYHRNGRRVGEVSSALLETTVRIITYICHKIVFDDYDKNDNDVVASSTDPHRQHCRAFVVRMNEILMEPLELATTIATPTTLMMMNTTPPGRGEIVTTFKHPHGGFEDDVSEISDSVAGEDD
jgi:hypothetical protein